MSDVPQMYKIGELANLANINTRTIDYYTTIGLIAPIERSTSNYRLYSDETLATLHRIEQLKRNKLTLEEIKAILHKRDSDLTEESVTQRLNELELQLSNIEREVKALEPVLKQMKPRQARQLFTKLTPQTAACIEALMLLMNKNTFM
ncbi:MerR family transcriptional regulator [Paenibacillus yanchengensis]|uniref:MerR family transcriptional regulator n=1 Tax=Paenibacillus yanchengensis TaxID=2035833 RepID=A0ABW4YP75_9BACL